MTKFYTVKEVAAELRLTPRTVYTMLRSGRLRAERIGKLYRITETQVAEFLRGSLSRKH